MLRILPREVLGMGRGSVRDVAAVKANRTMEFGASDRLRVCIDRICTSATETRFQSNTFCPFRMKGRLISHS